MDKLNLEIFDQLSGVLSDRTHELDEAITNFGPVMKFLGLEEITPDMIMPETPKKVTLSSEATEPAAEPKVDEAARASQERGLTRENLNLQAEARDLLNEVFKD